MALGGAPLGRLLLATALAYLTIGIVWETALELALAVSPRVGTDPEISPWNGLLSFLAWFALPSALWPWSLSELVPGGALLAIVLFAGMTAIMFAALRVIAPGARRPPPPARPRSARRAAADRPRTS